MSDILDEVKKAIENGEGIVIDIQNHDKQEILARPADEFDKDIEEMTEDELQRYLEYLEDQRHEMDDNEPEDDTEEHEQWEEDHEDLEDLIDEVQELIEQM
jgi:microcompartment protein CcmL/EutN